MSLETNTVYEPTNNKSNFSVKNKDKNEETNVEESSFMFNRDTPAKDLSGKSEKDFDKNILEASKRVSEDPKYSEDLDDDEKKTIEKIYELKEEPTKQSQTLYDTTAVGSEQEFYKAKQEQEKNISNIDKSDREIKTDIQKIKEASPDGTGHYEIKELKNVTVNGNPKYAIYVNGKEIRQFDDKEQAQDMVSRYEDAYRADKQLREYKIGDKTYEIKDFGKTKTKSEEIERALKWRGIGYLAYLKNKGVITDNEYNKYSKQIQDVRDIRKPGITKALNTAYLIYNAIANGFRNAGNLAFNVAGKGQVNFSDSALSSTLQNAFSKAQDIAEKKEIGKFEAGIGAYETGLKYSFEDKQNINKFIRDLEALRVEKSADKLRDFYNSYLRKDESHYAQVLGKEMKAYDKQIVYLLGKALNDLDAKGRADFLTGVMAENAKTPEGIFNIISDSNNWRRGAVGKSIWGAAVDVVRNGKNSEYAKELTDEELNEIEEQKNVLKENGINPEEYIDAVDYINNHNIDDFPTDTDEGDKGYNDYMQKLRLVQKCNKIIRNAEKRKEAVERINKAK